MLFKTKPTIVEAKRVPLNATTDDLTSIFEWLHEADLVEHWGRTYAGRLDLYLKNTRIKVKFGDWVVKTASGSVAVYSPDIFDQTFSWIGPEIYADPPYMVN